MSLRPQTISPICEEIASVARDFSAKEQFRQRRLDQHRKSLKPRSP